MYSHEVVVKSNRVDPQLKLKLIMINFYVDKLNVYPVPDLLS